ncbi:MAG: bifunctional UDP-N-acetylmuramoyl-tripeptide:D-alanyl-D-alanine ligase/alanine racemase [Bacteroidota bacterium]
MSYTIHKITAIVDGTLLNDTPFDYVIEHLLTDTRRILSASTSLFFAFKGMRQDGHDFMAAAYEKGVRNFVVTQQIEATEYPESNFIFVSNAHQAIHRLVRFHRQQFNIPVIGITGSNGKTVVKEWLFQLLHPDFRIVRSPRSYNSQLGVPLSVWQMQAQHELGIFEAGISTTGEMEKVSPIIQCNIGVFTNIGSAHDEGFPNRKTKIEEKLRLFGAAQVLIYCSDYPEIEAAVSTLEHLQTLTWSKHQAADLTIKSIESTAKETLIAATFQQKNIQFAIPFQDEASIENAIHCCLVLLHLGISPDTIAARMQELETVAMRLESRQGISNCLIINDSYNSDLTSLSMALDFLEQQSTHTKHTLVLSDILQSGTASEALYRSLAQRINEKIIHRLIGIGQEIDKLKPHLHSSTQTHFFAHTQDFLDHFEALHFQSEAILLKGARAFQFERIANRLAERIHQTILEVNITALLYNLNAFSQYLKPKTKMMVMVKAAAYGSGSVEIARLLEFQNMDYLAVAYADEGVELRKAGIQLPIMVLNPEESSFEAHFQYDLEPEIYSMPLLKKFIRYLPDQGNVPIHLKIETGMNRLGFEAQDLPDLLAILNNEPRLKIQSIFSHLAASEAPNHDTFTKQQVERFTNIYERICAALNYRPLQHILNTSGIIRFPEYQFDMVRLGIGLYGLDNGKDIQDQLQIVNSLKARISQIKDVRLSESVGYGRKGQLERDSRIATVSIGYADGLPRSVGNGRYSLLIRGELAPIVGNVCMDMCMVDVTDIPLAQEGDEVLIFGEQLPVDRLAAAARTIPLEIFTGITQRVKRVYFQE